MMCILYLLDTTIFTQTCSFNHMGLHGKKEGSDYCNKKTKENNTRIALHPSLVLYIFTYFGSAYIIKDQLSICISNKHQQWQFIRTWHLDRIREERGGLKVHFIGTLMNYHCYNEPNNKHSTGSITSTMGTKIGPIMTYIIIRVYNQKIVHCNVS